MNVQRLQIEQQMARIQIESQRAALRIEQGRRQMDVSYEAAQMSVERHNGKIDIDLTPLENNTGRMDALTLQRSVASQSAAAAQQGIEGISSDGNYVAQLPGNGVSRIGELARQKIISKKAAPTPGRSPVPPTPVELTADPGDLSIDWTPHQVEIDWGQVQQPSFSVEPAPQVNVELVQEPSLQFSVVELTIPAEPGQTIDTQA